MCILVLHLYYYFIMIISLHGGLEQRPPRLPHPGFLLGGVEGVPTAAQPSLGRGVVQGLVFHAGLVQRRLPKGFDRARKRKAATINGVQP